MEIGILFLFSFILVPLSAGVLSFLGNNKARYIASLGSLVTLGAAVYLITQFCGHPGLSIQKNVSWVPSLGASFSLAANEVSTILVLLTALVFCIIFIAIGSYKIERSARFYGLMMLSQAGLMGVFLAHDLLLFYFFWELALIPVYFLCSMWGGEKRVRVTFKFFIYTFLGSLIMLAGIIWLYLQTPARSFDYAGIVQTGQSLGSTTQQVLFCFFFIAFAIKMPILPFHTWQPDTYEQTFTPVTIVLSAVMVKMGLFGVYKWLIPVFPQGVELWSNTVMILAVAGILYGSLLAMAQTDIKRIVAYSSIAHIGLMCLGLFANTHIGFNGWLLQMFNHGINITGMWLIVMMIESRYGSRNLKELGGMAGSAPRMAVAFVIIAFANIALPLTNGFIGEFLLFMGIFQSANPYHITYMVLAGLGVILSAIYTLNMVQKSAYGEVKNGLVIKDTNVAETFSLIIVIVIIIVIGIYPNLLLGLMA